MNTITNVIYKGRFPAMMLLLLCYCLEMNSLQSQTVSGSTTNADSKALATTPQIHPDADHINLWNEDDAKDQSWMFHCQNTDIVQGYPGITSPYQGQNSLPPGGEIRETVSIDFYFGAHIWPGGELYFNPEVYQGFGLGNTLGIAQFTNAEAFKSGEQVGNFIIPRLFYRQTFGFGGEQEQLDSDELQLAQKVDVSRLTLTVGKVSYGDFFDDNAYSHDQRTQFMDWTLVDSGGFDSPQDADGYTNGFILNFNQKNWALTYGHFMVPKYLNSHALDYNLTKSWEDVLQLDERYSIGDHPGTVRLLGWLLAAHMGNYWDTVNTPSADMDITNTAAYRMQFGFALSADQEITKDLGVFTRISWGQPNDEAYLFSDLSESVALGSQLMGTAWSRPNDVVGLADTVGALSRGQAPYFNNGGTGTLIGDGHLSYAPESVTETYYDAELSKHVHLTGAFQFVVDPAFNSDRGPVPIVSLRLHVAF